MENKAFFFSWLTAQQWNERPLLGKESAREKLYFGPLKTNEMSPERWPF